MRQVGRDELVYQLFSALRGWSFRTRKDIFAVPHKRSRSGRKIACDHVAASFRYQEVIDTSAGVRVLDGEELSAVFEAALDRFPGAVGGLWLSTSHDRQREAQRTAAVLFAEAIAHLEILSDTIIDRYGMPVPFPSYQAEPHALRDRWP